MESVVHRVDGLSGSVEILIDPWGVPHIYAEELRDVFFGQGFNAARDRLWQLDIWKRRGDGTLAEATAEASLELAQARLEQDDTIRKADGTLPPDRLFSLRAPLTGVVRLCPAPAARILLSEGFTKIVSAR